MNRFYRGETILLNFSHSDFPKTDWSAKLILSGVGANSHEFDASASVTKECFEVEILPSDSTLVARGVYQVHFRYEDSDGRVRFQTGGRLAIDSAPTENTDKRSQWEQDLEATDNAIRAKISGGAVEEYEIHTTVGERRLKNMSLSDLRQHRRWLVGKVNAERVQRGEKPITGDRWRKIRSSLGNQSAVPRRRY